MKAKLATIPAFGIDTVLELSSTDCRFLVREGFHFVVRYLGMLTPDELKRVMCSGLALMPVTTSRGAGWTPSMQLGATDGQLAASRLADLSMPKGVTVWLDLEGCAGPAEKTADWINAWSQAVITAGYQAGRGGGPAPDGAPGAHRQPRQSGGAAFPTQRGRAPVQHLAAA